MGEMLPAACRHIPEEVAEVSFRDLHFFSLRKALTLKKSPYICVNIMIDGLRRMITFEL